MYFIFEAYEFLKLVNLVISILKKYFKGHLILLLNGICRTQTYTQSCLSTLTFSFGIHLHSSQAQISPPPFTLYPFYFVFFAHHRTTSPFFYPN